MSLPLLILALLLGAPTLDAKWQHNPTHFWLVALVALANMVIGARISGEASDRQDGRLFLVALGFTTSAAFFLVHALATPRVMVTGPTSGFSLAMPVGLLLASGFAAASSFEWSDDTSAALLRQNMKWRYGVVGLALLWAFLSLSEVPPLDGPISGSAFTAIVTPLGIIASVLFLFAAARYFRVHRSRPSPVTLALATSFVLLAEAMVIVTTARTWQLSWWEWHIVTVLGYGYVAYAAYVEFQREGRPAGLFASVALDATVERLRGEYRGALEELVASIGGAGSEAQVDESARALGDRFGLSAGQTEVFVGAAGALSSEKRHADLHAAMAQLSRHRVADTSPRELGDRAAAMLAEALDTPARFVPVVPDSSLPQAAGKDATDELPGRVATYPVVYQDRALGGVEVTLPEGRADDWEHDLLSSYCAQLATALDNLSLYRELRNLFGRYISPEVARRLLADPSRAELGGSIVEVSVLFADLRGFTSYTEGIGDPGAVVELLNSYFSAAVPIILEEGGTLDKFVGDALMAIFNTPVLQPDHASRAVRAAHRMQRAIDELAAGHPEWPRFRIGINTGSALVGNIGSDELRNFTSIGDAVNVAARLEQAADPGQVLLGETTYMLARHDIRVEPLGPLAVKGKDEEVAAYLLTGLMSDDR